MTHFTHTVFGWRQEETPFQRLQRQLEHDEWRRDRPAPSLAWQAEIDGFRAVGGVKFDARIRA